MRLDRLLTLYLFGPLARLRRNSGGLRIPILMYHSISDEPETGHPYYWINTSPARFAEHMKFLQDYGYQVISLNQAVEILNSQPATCNQQLTTFMSESTNKLNIPNKLSKLLVLTFDDGYRDFYTQAFPILEKYAFTATVFLPTAYIDGKQPGLRGKAHLRWSDVRKLAEQGINFGSHTVNHPRLHDLNFDEIEYEITQSKKEIEFQLNLDPRSESTNKLINKSFNKGNSQPVTCNPEPAVYNSQLAARNSEPTKNLNAKSEVLTSDLGPQTSNLNIQPNKPNEPNNFKVDSFCYPYKFPDQDKKFVVFLKSLLQTAAYNHCSTTRIACAGGSVDDFFLPRLPLNSGDDLPLFRAKMEGRYDWLHNIQSFAKKARSGSNKSHILKERLEIQNS
jgi:peptidoglycan/xylan/chitin deacetylase (PgdA/CDA1 family)